MGLMSRKIDPKLAQDIEEDMAELDGQPRAKKQSVKSETCDCMGLSQNGQPGTGLIDDHTICPKCQGTGKVAVLG
jgi:DnaJ-class molecular chaperone